MPTIRRFVVVPAVPEKLQPLTELAYNLWTIWNYEASGLFRRLDAELWESTNHNPVRRAVAGVAGQAGGGGGG